jgi:hypothetical protein
MIDQLEILSLVRSNLLDSFLELQNPVARCTGHGKVVWKFGVEKPIS